MTVRLYDPDDWPKSDLTEDEWFQFHAGAVGHNPEDYRFALIHDAVGDADDEPVDPYRRSADA